MSNVPVLSYRETVLLAAVSVCQDRSGVSLDLPASRGLDTDWGSLYREKLIVDRDGETFTTPRGDVALAEAAARNRRAGGGR